MDVAELRPINEIKNESCQRCSKISVQRWHCAIFYRAGKARTHDEFVTITETRNETAELTEIIRAISVTHNDVAAANVGDGINISAAKTTLWCLEDTRSGSNSYLGGTISRAIDDQNFGRDSSGS